jgi:hypothetical protein
MLSKKVAIKKNWARAGVSLIKTNPNTGQPTKK